MSNLRDRQLSLNARVDRKMRATGLNRGDAAMLVLRDIQSLRGKGFEPHVPGEKDYVVPSVETRVARREARIPAKEAVKTANDMRYEVEADFAVARRKHQIIKWTAIAIIFLTLIAAGVAAYFLALS